MGVFGHSPPYFFRHGLSPDRNTMIPLVEFVGCSVSPRDLLSLPRQQWGPRGVTSHQVFYLVLRFELRSPGLCSRWLMACAISPVPLPFVFWRVAQLRCSSQCNAPRSAFLALGFPVCTTMPSDVYLPLHVLVHPRDAKHRDVKRPCSASFCSLLRESPNTVTAVLEVSGTILGVDTPTVNIPFIRRWHRPGASLCTEAWQGRGNHTRP